MNRSPDMIRISCFLTLAVVASGLPGRPIAADEAAGSLGAYRQELEAFRKEFGGVRHLPDVRFFLFGMGAPPSFCTSPACSWRCPGGKSSGVVGDW